MADRIVGGGLAGSEAAWQAASRGVPVTLYEMRPARPTAVHKTDRLGELGCSNSSPRDKLNNAVRPLKITTWPPDSPVVPSPAAIPAPPSAGPCRGCPPP